MGCLFGPGFDSRQLHDQVEYNCPRKGAFALRRPLKACFHKVFEKKRTMDRVLNWPEDQPEQVLVEGWFVAVE